MNYSPAAEPISSSSRKSAKHRSLSRGAKALGFAILIAALSLGGCSRVEQANSNLPPAEPSSTSLPFPRAEQTDPKLAGVLDSLLNSPEYANGRWGIAVVSINDGKLIYQRNGEKLFTPASNMKLFTTAVALDLLGADYRWRTSVYADSNPDQDGAIKGDLILYGRGAPDLVAATKPNNDNSLENLARQLVQRGVKSIRGNIVGDESYFRGDAIGQGWQWNDLQWYFGAEASALTINSNSAEISITSASKIGEKPMVVSTDHDGYLQVTNDLVTVERSAKFRIGVHKGINDNNVRVWGDFPLGQRGYGVSLSVHRPSLWAARLFLSALRAQGITVTGDARWRDSRASQSERLDPQSKQELAFVNSDHLGIIVRTTNKLSVNLYAELLLRTVGRERQALLSTTDPPGRERGDDETGTSLIRLWLSRAGISTKDLAIHDGSGLSRLNLVTPEATAGLLGAIRKTSSGPAFTASLPVAAKDGTLAGRFQAVSEKVQAKTGTLTYDNSLSGYATSPSGQVLAFSVFCNDETGPSNANRLIDRLVTAMISPTLVNTDSLKQRSKR